MTGRYPVNAAYGGGVGGGVVLFACQQVVFYGAKAFRFYDQPDS